MAETQNICPDLLDGDMIFSENRVISIVSILSLGQSIQIARKIDNRETFWE